MGIVDDSIDLSIDDESESVGVGPVAVKLEPEYVTGAEKQHMTGKFGLVKHEKSRHHVTRQDTDENIIILIVLIGTCFWQSDDGGGMDPEAMRRCMSFGFSDKNSKHAIGQYGNGFKTSSMRLDADAIVFSRHMNNGYGSKSQYMIL